jgi:nucleoside 2-deoxyribosyltransferase
MRIYLAASFDAQEAMKARRDGLHAAGYKVTSRWIDVKMVEPESVYAMDHGFGDLQDIQSSDIVIIDTNVPSTTGGFNVELGFALGQGIPVMHTGPRVNIFFRHPGVTHYTEWSDILDALKREEQYYD